MTPPDAVTVSELADAAGVVLRVLMNEASDSPATPAGPRFRRLASDIVNDIWVAVRLGPSNPDALDQDAPAVDRAATTIGRTLVRVVTTMDGAEPSPMIREVARKIAEALNNSGQLARLMPPPEVTR